MTSSRWMQRLLLLATLLAPVLGVWPLAHAAPTGPRSAALAAAEDPDNARVIVKYRAGSSLAQDAAGRPRHALRLGRQLALPALQDGQVLGRRTQSLRARGLSSSQLAARLAALPEVEWAEPAQRKRISAVLPNDPYYAAGQASPLPVVGQWYLRAPDATLVSAINAVGAWGVTTGSSAITVAVVDTGVRFDHPDLAGKLHPGHDFVRQSIAGDGDGPDADASDPGDGHASGCSTAASSWHGTEVAGLVGAATDNGIGIASVGRDVMVLPVRVLGECGSGWDDDIIAGMLWAANLSPGLSNPHPARVINLSLGGEGSCDANSNQGRLYREPIAQLLAAGVTVVAAAGNGEGLAVSAPANCSGVIAVAAVRHAGTKVGFSNLGPEVAIAAPGANCVNDVDNFPNLPCLYMLVTTTNSGTSTPAASSYSDSLHYGVGTSFSTPLVAGTAGLMLSVDPTLTPAQVKAALQASARPFPSTGAQAAGAVACHAPTTAPQNECYCTTTTCGAGMLDAGAAVTQVQAALLAPVAVISVSTATPTAGSSVALSGSASSASSGRTLGYQWAITSGASLASLVGATDGSSATLATSGAGTVVISLTVTDSAGATASSSQSLSVAAAPVVVTAPADSGGGGGGAMGLGWVLGLALAVAVLRRSPARQAADRP